jgi:5-hydroxyisourate hydrolase-like protein (transthyretin family)
MPQDQSSRWSAFLRFGLAALVLAAIPLVVLLWPDPPEAEAAALSADAAAVHRTRDNKLWVAVTLTNTGKTKLQGKLEVELLDASGQSLAAREREVEQADRTGSYQFEFPVGEKTDGLKLRYRFGKEQFEAALPKILFAKAHETSLATSQEFYPGSSAALRCGVHAVKSFVDTVPLAGAAVEVKLHAKDGKVHDLYAGKTGDDGTARVEFQVPKLPSGDYKLEVATKSALGEEKLERNVKLRSEPKVLLVTDKPLYQPGQLIHIRALCLRPFDLTPAGDSDLVFEVEDPKGNKVYKRSQKTSEFGIASVDFQLADEINMGEYQVRALIGNQQAQKTVTVKRYVLPKFKVEVTADKKFYLPKETIAVDLQSDYFFGKPVAGGKVKVTASTFDVQFRDFQTVEAKTDAKGHARVEIKLPDYFVGQPLAKGDALVKLEVKLTDTADHTETVSRTYPVADQPIRVSLIPEGGRLVPGLENRIFAAAIYPDGSPASGCEVKLWKGREGKGKPHSAIRTNDAGLAEFRIRPEAKEFRQGEWGPRAIEMAGGVAPQVWGPRSLLDVTVEAKDARGSTARAVAALNSDPLGENVLLRLDKAIYRGGDALKIDIHTSAGLPTVYLDIIKSGQTLLTRWLDVKDGGASHKLDLPPGLFGTLEVHAYQQLASGEIIRDSRVVYVHSRDDLKVEAKADHDTYLPGQSGKIVFTVTDARGNPTAAALGIIIVDEAVYALQEMQPGLEKVYFTLQEELLKPQAQLAGVEPVLPIGPPIPGPGPVPLPNGGGGAPAAAPAAPQVPPGPAVFKPSTTLDALVREGDLPAQKQQIAEVLLTAVKPKPPARWTVDPALERMQKMQGQLQQIGWGLFNHASMGQEVLSYDKKSKRWTYAPDLLDKVVKAGQIQKEALKDPFGRPVTLEGLARIEKDFTPERLGAAVTAMHMQNLMWPLADLANRNRARWLKDGKWTFPDTALADAIKLHRQQERFLKDAWGQPIKLVKSDARLANPMGWEQFNHHQLVAAGPDGKFGTDDDIRSSSSNPWQMANGMWFLRDLGKDDGAAFRWRGVHRFGGGMPMMEAAGLGGAPGGPPPAPAGPGGGGGGLPLARPEAPMAPPPPAGGDQGGAAAKPVRLREYFPETMLWQPALITDERGRAELSLSFADSITTWRLSASASSKSGALGGLTAPLRVFQDFFVDLDLPVTLTQNDEVAFPVAVYNYLKEPQTVKLELQPEPWFDLLDSGGLVRSLDLKPNEVTSIKYRIKARKIGFHPLTVKAAGSKMSDAIKRSIEVVPDGKKVEQVVSDKLSGKVKQTLEIPEIAIPDASKLFVKLYPGVFSQVLEGTEGMLRMPGG